TIENYVQEDLIVPLDLKQLPNYQPQNYTDQRFTQPGTVNGQVYAVHKDWGTTGYSVNTKHVSETMSSWKDFWDLTVTKYSNRTMVHDYQLTTIGNALKYYGYSFNSLDEKELADAEKLLLNAKPHLFAINSDYQPSMRSGDAWLTVAWTGDANQLHRDMPEIVYVIGKEGGEIWSDFFAIPKEAPNQAGAYALINYLLDPAVNKDEVLAHGYPVADKRVFDLLPEDIKTNTIMYPAADLLSPLEFGAAATLTNPARAEIMARFKSA
ncbi:MAG: spermidine/putrescine ABC transporter substrate-binding protein, partial [Dongiaceae bacterium]